MTPTFGAAIKTAPDLIVGRQSHTIKKREHPRSRGLKSLYDSGCLVFLYVIGGTKVIKYFDNDLIPGYKN